MIDMQERFLTPEQIAKVLQVSEDTIMRLLKERQLKGVKVRGQWRIRECSLEEFLEKKSNMQEDK